MPSPEPNDESPIFPESPDPAVPTWQERLVLIVDTMQEMSRLNDPQAMVRAYAEKMSLLVASHRRLSLSRRGLVAPHFRITRSTTWSSEINPWTDKDRLPLLEGGLLAELLYRGKTEVIDDLQFSPDDPALEYLAGCHSLLAIPMYDQGEPLNMVVILRDAVDAFVKDEIPDLVWRSNLFGRATGSLVLKQELQRAYEALDREMKIVAEIQRSLLPSELPEIPTLDLAAYYRPSHRAGGDYYDFFPLPDGQWGIFVGDVSGHGTPAAVLMAVTHCIAHTRVGPACPPGRVLSYLNHHLSSRYTQQNGSFVTAFYAVYDPKSCRLTYASAGHNAPRVKRCGDESLLMLDECNGFPLGIVADVAYEERVAQLETGDRLVFYTDGITEAHNPQGELFGTSRLDRAIAHCGVRASDVLDAVLQSVQTFVADHPILDDQTLIVARVVGKEQ